MRIKIAPTTQDVYKRQVNKRLMLVLHDNPFLRLLLPDGADFEAVFLLLGSDSTGIDGVDVYKRQALS